MSSCEKTVTFDLDDVPPKLVVEATIENGQFPIVYLSRSLAYFSTIDQQELENNFVRQADVYVSGGTMTSKLKEYSTVIGSSTFYYYTIDSSDLSTAVFGQLDSNYSLRIVVDGNEYNAVTHIPLITKNIISLYSEAAPAGNDSDQVSLKLVAADPPGFGDYVRYYTKRNSEPFYPGLTSVYDDQVIDGSVYDIQVERGVDRNEDRPDGFVFFNKGDTVTLKLSNIDKATYDFWRTMEFTYASVGNPFSSPTKVLSNISNGALGYFGGYASQYRTLIIPR